MSLQLDKYTFQIQVFWKNFFQIIPTNIITLNHDWFICYMNGILDCQYIFFEYQLDTHHIQQKRCQTYSWSHINHMFLCIKKKKKNPVLYVWGFPDGSEGKACNVGDLGSIPVSGRSPGEGNGNPLQFSCLENPMDREAWQSTVHGVTKSQTRLSDFTHSLTTRYWTVICLLGTSTCRHVGKSIQIKEGTEVSMGVTD